MCYNGIPRPVKWQGLQGSEITSRTLLSNKEYHMTHKQLHDLFEYKDGVLYNKTTRNSRNTKGSAVGSTTKQGYLAVQVDDRKYRIHRIIYKMFNSGWDILSSRADGCIDHIDGDPLNNNIENLRLITHQDNTRNKVSAKGYHKRKDMKSDKWRASLRVDGHTKNLGQFDTEEEARGAYLEAKNKYHKIKEIEYV